MRTVAGEVVVPRGVTAHVVPLVVVEVSDVSLADASAVTLARLELADVLVEPGGRIPFRLDVPEAARNARLAVHAHVDANGTRAFSEGDLLTTQHVSVPSLGDVERVEVPVALI